MLAATESTQSREARPKGLGCRHYVTFMLGLGMANAYIMKTNMAVAIVAMVNQTAIRPPDFYDSECGHYNHSMFPHLQHQEGTFLWSMKLQGEIQAAFFIGYVLTQIPFGLLAKRYGAHYILGVGMLVNALMALLVPLSAHAGPYWLIGVRLIQGLGEGPIVPCTHALLAKWIPPHERSRMNTLAYSGAQLGTVVSYPLSGLLAEYGFAGGWPSIFYVFGMVGIIWALLFIMTVFEDPEKSTWIGSVEKKYIIESLGGKVGELVKPGPIPWRQIASSLPFWAIMSAHIGQNYGYETLMTELPTFMRQVFFFSLKQNGILSAAPYLSMWFFSIFISHVADYLISKRILSTTSVRKIVNSIGQYGPALGLLAAGHTQCDRFWTLACLCIGIGLNGGIYSGFKVNHLDISANYAAILIALTNCMANMVGLLTPIIASNIVNDTPTIARWRIVFYLAAGVYIINATIFNIFASGVNQPWNDVKEKEDKSVDNKTKADKSAKTK